ncbi:MAG: RNA methyltransferase [Dehalococcoidia bacterium]|nr:RNA methyltransferase [Dehalococcoidia bacterium]
MPRPPVEPERITSTANARIKRIRGLRLRKERDEAGLSFVEGIRTVAEAVQLRAPIETLIDCPELLRSPFGRDLVDAARAADIDVIEVSEEVFRTLSRRDGPQGIAAVVRQEWERLQDLRLAPGDRWVALEEAADAGNIGTIVRTCDATGADGIILLDHTADPYDPVAMRASTGAVFTVRLVRATFEQFIEWSRAQGVTVVGTAGDATEGYRTAEYGDRTVILMGSERAGLPPEHQRECDRMVSIPMVGRVDSLNLAVATGLVLYEVLEHRRRAGRA